MKKTYVVGLIFLSFGILIEATSGQQLPPQENLPSAEMLPMSLAETARQFLNYNLSRDKRLELAEILVDVDPAASYRFLTAAALVEPDANVRALLVAGLDPEVSPLARAALEQAQADSDPTVRQIARDELIWNRVIKRKKLQRDLAKIAASAESQEDPSRAKALALAADTLDATSEEGDPPSRLFEPGPDQKIDAPTPLRVAIIGDFGTDKHGVNDSQEKVAATLKKFHTQKAFHFGLTVGDNFYNKGLSSVDNSRWRTDWEIPYGGLVPILAFYAVPGNHDWDGKWRAVLAEMDYTDVSPSKTWRMPGTCYSISAGSVDFFAIDTDQMYQGEKDWQLDWLAKRLSLSKARWKVVFGHHPVLSGGEGHGHAQSTGEDSELRILREEVLLPVLINGGAHLYIAGHDHELQLLKLQGLYHSINGAGGRESDSVLKLPESIYCAKTFGFTVLEVMDNELTLQHVRVGASSPDYSCVLKRYDTPPFVRDTCTVGCPR